MTKNFLITILFLSACMLQSQQISNIQPEQVSKKINIYYDLFGDGIFEIKVYYSQDGGITWGQSLKSVIGDVGREQKAGYGKKITWDVLADLEKLQGNVTFKVEAISKLIKAAPTTFISEKDGNNVNTVKISNKDFKGEIQYKINYEGSGVTDEMKTMMPKTMTMTIKGNKARSEMIMSMGKTVSISDGDLKSAITLMDMMGQKIAIQSTNEDIMKEMAESPEVKVEVTSETKDILGYICKKAIITNTEDDMELIVYFTEKLGSKELNFDNPQFKDINGVMLEFEIPNESFSMHFTAVSVEKKSVDDSEFTIPNGYQIKTKKEMKSMFGGG